MFKNKTILITGGTGSFGKTVLKYFLNKKVKEIRIFSRDEKKQDDIRKKYNEKKLKFYIGDVRDYNSINNAVKGCDYVFHAAALKQVPSCEFYPMEAVKTNILGTENLLKSEGLSQFRLQGHTGITESNDLGLKERVAVIYLGPRAFIFRGEIPANADEEELDQMLLSSIRSFRAIQRGEVVAGGELKIKFVQATEFFDFSIVSQNSKIANFPEETLRLLNGYYPTGNPKEGEWIKLVE